MIINSSRSKERNKALEELNYTLKIRSKVLVIHYSCESFLNRRDRVPRITSIAVHNLESGQTKSFSIYLTAQTTGEAVGRLTENARDRLEKATLTDFYKYVRKHKNHKWVHWRMRNQVYGFEAINARYKILGGKPVSIADSNKYDLQAAIEQLYTSNFEKSSKAGRLLSLAKRNGIEIGDAIPGHQEAKAYEDGGHQLLWMSSQRKSEIIAELLNLASDDKLKVATNSINVHGLSWKLVKKTYPLSLLFLIMGFIGKEILSITVESLSEHFSLGALILSILGIK